jgi:hypothetical protein
MIYDQNIKIIYGCSVFVWRASDTTLLLIFSDVVLARPIELCGCGEDCGSNVPMVPEYSYYVKKGDSLLLILFEIRMHLVLYYTPAV